MFALFFANNLRLTMLELEDDTFVKKKRPVKGFELTQTPKRKSSEHSDSIDEDLNNSQTLL